MPKVRFTRAGAVELEVDLEARDYRVGRASDNDLVLQDPDKTLSRHHAEIRFDGTQWMYLDLNSANGSWVEGVQVTRQPFDRNLSLTLGDYELAFLSGMPRMEDTAPDADGTRLIPVGQFQEAASPAAGDARARDTSVIATGSAVPSASAGAQAAPAKKAAASGKWSPMRRAIVYGWILVLGAVAIMFAAMLRPDPAPSDSGTAVQADAQSAATAQVQVSTSVAPPTTTAAPIQPAVTQQATPPAPQGPAPAATTRATPPPSTSIPRVTTTAPPAPAPRTAAGPPSETRPLPARPATTPAAPPRRAARADTDADASALPPLPGESAAALKARRDDVRGRYDTALQRLAARQYGEARTLLAAIAAEAPRFRDVAGRMAEAESGLRQQAKEGFDAAARHEQAGEWAEAVREYERLRPHAASLPDLDGAITRTRGRMHEAGAEALTRARQFDSRGRVPEAVGWYQRAIAWLPADHPGLEAARQRLAQLGGRP